MRVQDTISGTVGPFGRSVRDLELFMTTVLASRPWEWDQSMMKMPWRRDEVVWKGRSGPRVGVMWDDGVVRPQPPMRRALNMAVEKLRSKGVEVVDFKPHKSAEAWEIIVGYFLERTRAK